MLARKALAGTAGAPKVYVEDVFSTYLYTGTGSSQTITNNIDLSGKGGLVWTKNRNGAQSNYLVDTVTGAQKELISNSTAAQANNSGGITSFSSSGYSIGTDGGYNGNADTYASWTFRKAEKFFDVVTFTGPTTGNTITVNHNLGSVPGMIIYRSYANSDNWYVWHRSLTPNYYLQLESTAAQSDGAHNYNVTSTSFSLRAGFNIAANGGNCIAYLFAHDAGGFGDAGSDSIIKCGSYTTDGSGNATVTLDWEPQWLLVKPSSTTGNWNIIDNMRGMPVANATTFLQPNTTQAETTYTSGSIRPTATGFSENNYWGANTTVIYIAIRRGPMKTPETGTSVFETDAAGNNAAAGALAFSAGFPVDWYVRGDRSGSNKFYGFTRLTRNEYLTTTSTAAGATTTYGDQFDNMTGIETTDSVDFTGQCGWLFRRAPKFFDVVCWTASGTSWTSSHNLGVSPELIISKNRTGTTTYWYTYASSFANVKKYALLNTNGSVSTAGFDVWALSSTSVSGYSDTSNGTGVAYLFASCPGVSKIGTYTGNGSSVTVTTDFQPRFILVKRTDNNGNWIVGDSARGLPTGNDPALFLNATDAETTGQDWVDVSSTGFTVNETALNANVNTGTYIYLAIA